MSPPEPAARLSAPTVLRVEVGLVENVCSLICDAATATCALVDPAFEVDRILAAVAALGLRVTAVLLTHSHLDHIEGVPELCRRVGPLPIYIGAGEQEAVRELGAAAGQALELVPLAGGEELRCGSLAIAVLPTPGHTRAGRSYYLPALAAVLTGDTLFVGSCGRPRDPASAAQLFASLQLLGELPEETRLYPGHDYGPRPTSTLSWEHEHNQFLRCRDAAAFTALLRRRG